jgi:hypothetical protein
MEPLSPEEGVQALEDAAAVLEKHGWAQGSYRIGKRCCIMGALGMALTGSSSRLGSNNPRKEKLYLNLISLLAARIEPGTSLSVWNDDDARTAEEVIHHLRDTAEALKSGEVTYVY